MWNITDNVAVGFDAYRMKLEQIINTPSGQFIINQCAVGDQAFCDDITRDSAGTLNGGSLSAIARNLSLQEIEGVDFNASWDVNAGNWGRFNLDAETSWVNELTTQFNDDAPKTAGVGIFSIPEWRSNLTANWRRANLGATVRATYVGSLGGVNSTAPLESAEKVDDQITLNAQVRYALGQRAELRIGVNNLTNESPPVDPTNPQWPWFINAGGFYSPFGREFYAEWLHHW